MHDTCHKTQRRGILIEKSVIKEGVTVITVNTFTAHGINNIFTVCD